MTAPIITKNSNESNTNTPIAALFPSILKTHTQNHITWTDLVAMAEAPTSVGKTEAPAIACQLTGTKKLPPVVENNIMTMLWIDIDKGNKSREEITQRLRALGITRFIIYSTASSMRLDKDTNTVNGMKWRVLIDLNQPIPCEMWINIQRAFVSLFDADKKAELVQQILFAPNNPKVTDPREERHYDHEVSDGAPFDISQMHPDLYAAYQKAAERAVELSSVVHAGIVDENHPLYRAVAEHVHFTGNGLANDAGWIPCHCPVGSHEDDTQTGFKINEQGEYWYQCFHESCLPKSGKWNGFEFVDYLEKNVEGCQGLKQGIKAYTSNFQAIKGVEGVMSPAPTKQDSGVVSGLKLGSWGHLSNTQFEEVDWVIDKILPPGVSIFAGKPKCGKSWLVLGMQLKIAAGQPCFGHKTFQSHVLYMALEDSERRIQNRTNLLMKEYGITNDDLKDRFHYTTDANRIGEGFEEQVAGVLAQDPEIRLVCIDVLARVKPERKGSQSVYDADYAVGQAIKVLSASYPNVAFLIVHHHRKGAADGVDAVSGTFGLVGGMDNVFNLNKSEASGIGGFELEINGRDIEDDGAIPLTKTNTGMWTFEAKEEAKRHTQSETRNKILDAIDNGHQSPKAIGDETQLSAEVITQQLHRMTSVGTIERYSYGKYRRLGFDGAATAPIAPYNPETLPLFLQ